MIKGGEGSPVTRGPEKNDDQRNRMGKTGLFAGSCSEVHSFSEPSVVAGWVSPRCLLCSHCLFPLWIICWNLTSKMTVLGGGAFGEWLGHEGGASRKGFRPLQEGLKRALVPLWSWEIQWEISSLQLEQFSCQPPELQPLDFCYL